MVQLNSLDFLTLLCGFFGMNNDQYKENLSRFLVDLRGDLSYRDFSLKIKINYASLRTWEKMQSFPTLESLELIAKYKNWSLIQFLQYLGFQITIDTIDQFIVSNFDKDDRIKLARKLLDFE